MSRIRDVYRAFAGAVTLALVVMQYVQVTEGDSGAALRAATIHFFSFFTILSNLLVAATLLIPLIAPASAVGQFLARPSVRTAVTAYIIVVGVVYYLLLDGLSQATGWRLTFELALHYLTPPLFVLDWLLFVPKGDLAWMPRAGALAFPAVYAVWILILGAATGWYPYPFLDVGKHGYAGVGLTIAWLVIAFLILGLALVGCGRLMQRMGLADPPHDA
jgi:hypothetical protein